MDQNFHRFGLTVVFFAFQLFVHSFFLFGAKPKSTRAFFGAPLLADHSLCPPENGVRSMAAPHEIGHFFGGEFKLDAKMYGSFEAFPL